MFQELSLIPDLTVEQNIWFRREALSLLGTVGAAMRRKTLGAVRPLPFPDAAPTRRCAA